MTKEINKKSNEKLRNNQEIICINYSKNIKKIITSIAVARLKPRSMSAISPLNSAVKCASGQVMDRCILAENRISYTNDHLNTNKTCTRACQLTAPKGRLMGQVCRENFENSLQNSGNLYAIGQLTTSERTHSIIEKIKVKELFFTNLISIIEIVASLFSIIFNPLDKIMLKDGET